MSNKKVKFKEPTKPVGTVAELFAGVGGFRIGLAAAGFKTVYSNQWEPATKVQHASEVYVANFGSEGHDNRDISKVEKIPAKFDLLVGGFPCQDYSVAKTLNQSKGLKGKKGVLWWEIVKFIETADEISISMIQRHYRIGFNRSARLIEKLEMEGYLAPAQGAKPRKVIR